MGLLARRHYHAPLQHCDFFIHQRALVDDVRELQGLID